MVSHNTQVEDEPMTPVKVGYARKSDVKSDLQNQINLMRAEWGEDLTIVEELASGRSKRPKLMNLINNLPEGSTIYVVHSDRLTRCGIRDVWRIDFIAEMRKITIESLHEGVLTKPMTQEEQVMRSLKAMGASMEAEAVGRRVRDMFKRRAAQGLLSGVHLAIARGNHRHAGKERNPKIVAAEPRIHELKALGRTMRQIQNEIEREFQHKISLNWIHKLLKKAQPIAS